MPPALTSTITPVEFSLPTPEQLGELVSNVQKRIRSEKLSLCPPELRHDIISGLRGLTSSEAAMQEPTTVPVGAAGVQMPQ